MALAQCEHLFNDHPSWKRVPAEDTAGSVREVLARQDKSLAAIAGQGAADHYRGVIIAKSVQDNAENFTRFVLLVPESQAAAQATPDAHKMSIAMRLAHRPGALLAALELFARHEVNLLKIESRPIHGRPWEYQFFLDLESDGTEQLAQALADVRDSTTEIRILGRYAAGKALNAK
jgi:prephenate dehydratase